MNAPPAPSEADFAEAEYLVHFPPHVTALALARVRAEEREKIKEKLCDNCRQILG